MSLHEKDTNRNLFDICWPKLKTNMSKAVKNNKFYEDIFLRDNIQLDNINSYEQFTQIPIMTKDIYRENIEHFYNSVKDKNYILLKTSGSTGIPNKIYRTREDEASQNIILCKYRNRRSANIVFEKWVYLHYLHVQGYENENESGYKIERKSDKCSHFAYTYINDTILRSIYDYFSEFKPKWIVGNTSVIFAFADYIKRNNLNVSSFPLKYIECMSEYLTQEQRDVIAEVFEINPVSVYGANEVSAIAFECACGNMHLIKESVFVEILNHEEGKGGEVVVSSLSNSYTPFFRYYQGDKAEWGSESCNCGIDSPIIKLKGYRNNDFILTRDGTKLEVWYLNSIFRLVENKIGLKFRQFQFIQNDYNSFELILLINNQDNKAVYKIFENEFINSFNMLFKEPISVKFNYTETLIPVDSLSGKFKYFKSLLK